MTIEDQVEAQLDEQFENGREVGKIEGVQSHAEAVLIDAEELRGSAEKFEVLAAWARRTAMELHMEADHKAKPVAS